MLKPIMRCISAASLAIAGFGAIANAAPGDGVRQVVQAQGQINEAAAASQTTVNAASDQAMELVQEYLTNREQIDRLRVYNQNLTSLVRDQQDEVASIAKQMKDAEIVEKEIVPLMLKMVATLDQFVKLDLPFLYEERSNRAAQLREMMDRADVTISEKYRRVMEAYQIETDYGRTIEAYRGNLKLEGANEREVDFLRVGRLVLAYQTLDREETGYFNPKTRKFEELGSTYRGSISEGLRVARKQVAPNLISLPITAPEAAK